MSVVADLVLRGATIIAMDGQAPIERGLIAVKDGRIMALGPAAELQHLTGRVTVDAPCKLVIPGLINTHTHLFQTLLKGIARDKPLVEWLEASPRRLLPVLTPESYRMAAMLGCIDALRSGCTTILEYMTASPAPGTSDAILAAFRATGIRGMLARIVGEPRPGAFNRSLRAFETLDEAAADCRRLARANPPSAGFNPIWVSTLTIWNSTTAGLQRAASLARELNLPVTTHTCEIELDDRIALELYGKRTLTALAGEGLLDGHFLGVHCVHISEEDIALLRAHGGCVSHNPVPNMLLGSGVAPIPRLLAAGVPVGLGTDGAASNDTQDMLETMKITALLHKAVTRDPAVVSAQAVLEMATRNAAQAVNAGGVLGSLEPGKLADMVVLDPLRPRSVPVHDPVNSLVYTMNPTNVDSVIVGGEFVIKDGAFISLDEEQLLRECSTLAARLLERSSVGFD